MTMRFSRSNPPACGFTLIEVMLAILILSIGLVVLVHSASRCLAVIKSARIYEDARHLIARVDLENPIDREEFEASNESGSFEGEYGDYRWEREIVQDGEDEDGFYIVTTRILWSKKGSRQPGREEVARYMYVPESAKNGSF